MTSTYLGNGISVGMSEHGDVVLVTNDGHLIVLDALLLIGLLRYLEAQELVRWTPYSEQTEVTK